MLEQVDDPLAMLRAHRDRLAEAEGKGLEDPGLAGSAFGLVGRKNDRRALRAEPAGDFLVQRSRPGAGVDQEQSDIGIAHSGDGLRTHPARQGVGILILVAGGVDDPKVEPEQARLTLPPIAGDARPIVDQGELAAHQPVEQGGFADVGPAHDGDGRQSGHGRSPCPLGGAGSTD
jgi:hypothetical protein